MRTRRLFFLLLLVTLLVTLGVGCGQTGTKYPEKPITLIVQSSAGGGSDIFARTLASGFEKEKLLAQPVVVENKSGGSGAVAFAYTAGKKGDPYYIQTAVANFLTTPLQGLSQVTYKDFTPIANFAFDEYVVLVKADSKYKTMQDIVADAKARPKEIKVGGAELGASDSIATYLLEKAAGVKFNYIVFTGGGESTAALLGGHVDMVVGNPGESMEMVKGNKVRALGVFAEKRLAGWPDLPTMKEQGIDATYVQNRGIVAPGGLPAAERKALEDAMKKYFDGATFKAYTKDNFLTEAWMDGETFTKWLDSENNRYRTILTEMGVLKAK
jgi:putative tricarboxylic transport membrane protein